MAHPIISTKFATENVRQLTLLNVFVNIDHGLGDNKLALTNYKHTFLFLSTGKTFQSRTSKYNIVMYKPCRVYSVDMHKVC